jgi:GH15 family glucan-1,4-alpha-glucosidase
MNDTGYEKALKLMEVCKSKDGFLATPTKLDNYRRIWARDGCIIGLAALMTGKEDLIDGCRRTLKTLSVHQGPHGEIPSNVDTHTQRVSYGGTTGRVDADLWFIISCSQYWKVTRDDNFLSEMLHSIEKTRYLLGVWEFNNRGLLYVPLTGDWADEYLHNGYVLYDQLLYFQAQRELCEIHKFIHGTEDHDLSERVVRLKGIIQDNYWLTEKEELPDRVYHEVLYKKSKKAKSRCANTYWAPFFSPAGYGYRFDTIANSLVSLMNVSNTNQAEAVDAYINTEINKDQILPLPAFYPVITPKDDDWEELQLTFSYSFKNQPYEYHNGGLWPLVTGFYIADLAQRGKKEQAKKYLKAIHQTNQKPMENDAWSFPEYLHGKTYEPGGTKHMGWSAAAAIIGEESLNGKKLFLD